jgi:transcriptional regulator with XRE-family HTH domain
MTNLPTTSIDAAKKIASAARERRLSLNLSQKTLSRTSGVSHAVIKKFELTGKISLQSLLKIAIALGNIDNFTELFKYDIAATIKTLDELIRQTTRKRGRG